MGQEDLLEKGMATHSNLLAWRIPWTAETSGLLLAWRIPWTAEPGGLLLAWRIPWTAEPGGLQSIGLQGVKHD